MRYSSVIQGHVETFNTRLNSELEKITYLYKIVLITNKAGAESGA